LAGDELEIGHNFWSQTGENRNAVIVVFDDASQSLRIQYEYGAVSTVSDLRIQHKTSGNTVNVNATILSHFAFKIRTWNTGAGSSASNNAGPLTSEPGYYFTETSGTLYDILSSTKQVSFSHGFGVVPRMVRVVVVCSTADSLGFGYNNGDEIEGSDLRYFAGNERMWGPAFQTRCTSSGISLRFENSIAPTGAYGDYGDHLIMMNTAGQQHFFSTYSGSNTRYKLKVYAWK